MHSQLSQIINTQNQFTNTQIEEGFSAWPKNLKTCIQRASSFASLKQKVQTTKSAETEMAFENLENSVKTLEPLLREYTNVEKEGYEQVCFQGSPWSQLNFIPFALMIMSLYKTYFVPAIGVFLPFVSILLPYIFLNTFYNVPITFTEYIKLIWRMWNGTLAFPRTPEDLLNPQPAGPPANPLTQLKTIVQNSWTVFTFGQAMWHPIQQARHFMKLDVDCIRLGSAIILVKTSAATLHSLWKPWMPSWLSSWITLCPDDIRQAFAYCLETPFWLHHIFRALGRFEVLYSLAARDDVVPAQFVNSKSPVLMLKEFGDPSIPSEKRIVSSVRLGVENSHAILTGPNRGGKSSFLRGVLMNVVVAHSFGAAFAKKAQMTMFSWIADGMRLDDTPGEQSMFEREVAFGSQVLKKQGGRGLVLYDELFHSTNPPDAKTTSELFCKTLWKKNNCVSIVSTHVYSLAKQSPPNIQRLCMASWKKENKYAFSYTVQKGICEVSSVDLLLQQFGFMRANIKKES